jgi:hypothetical protein
MINSFIEKNIATHPIYITADVLQSDQNIGANYVKVPQGLAFRLSAKTDSIPILKSKFDLERFSEIKPDNHLERGIFQVSAVAFKTCANYALQSGQPDSAKVFSAHSEKLMREINRN